MTQSCLFCLKISLLKSFPELLKWPFEMPEKLHPYIVSTVVSWKGTCLATQENLHLLWSETQKLPPFPTHVLALWTQIQLCEVWFRDPILKTWGRIISTKTLQNVNKGKVFTLSTEVECAFSLAYCIVCLLICLVFLTPEIHL